MKHTQEKKSIIVKPVNRPLKGSIRIPSDKSISHRAVMLGALTNGIVEISNFSAGADCRSTLGIFQALGVEVEYKSDKNIILSSKNGLRESIDCLDAGNSGTTTRLMAGLLSGQNFYSVITGDQSLRSRPMARVIKPLKQMGASIWARESDTKAPISIKGTQLTGITYESPMASAQIKSSLLFAGLFASGKTVINEPYKSRDHSEKMLSYLGANLVDSGNTVEISASNLQPKPLIIPGDISSAAFFIVAACIVPDSEIIIQDVGLNPTRTGIVDVMREMGADIEILDLKTQCGEEVGDIKVKFSDLKGITISGDMIPRIIDEIPVIAVAASQATGTTIIKNAEDLRNKESDRIKTVCNELSKFGVDITETPDGFIISGKTNLKGKNVLECYHDHRIAMSCYIAGLISDNPNEINEFHWVNISFPEFVDTVNKLLNKGELIYGK
ncbi:MAG: 3-phosphoshikimate 1-carboxyvinyltransferase [Bacteroidota bacterium]|nr:3-phosphoshikimate 1-carboxyvinyltransferase [Bacteroidota bacterium]